MVKMLPENETQTLSQRTTVILIVIFVVMAVSTLWWSSYMEREYVAARSPNVFINKRGQTVEQYCGSVLKWAKENPDKKIISASRHHADIYEIVYE